MSELHLPWLEAAVLLPLIGAICLTRERDPERARHWCLFFAVAAFCCVFCAWLDFESLEAERANDGWRLLSPIFEEPVLVIDELSGPLSSLTALLYALAVAATARTKARRFSFRLTLLSEALTLATLNCQRPWMLIALLALGGLPPYLDLRLRGQPTRIYAIHMTAFIVLMVLGWRLATSQDASRPAMAWSLLPLVAAVLIRSGIAPFHAWLSDLFEHARLGTALLFVAPLPGAYAAVRLLLPIAPTGVLQSIGLLSLATAIYASGMALVQRDARRFFCYLFLSHSSLVLVGLEGVTPLSLTGAMCVWLSAGLALGGFGLTLRALETRIGPLSLTDFHGLYEHTPNLAICFLLTGLASVGFPGAFGFVGMELLVDGVVSAYPYVGVLILLAAAVNGIAIVRAFFLLFTGKKYFSAVSLQVRARERYAVLALAALILIGGVFPQPMVDCCNRAAKLVEQQRWASWQGTSVMANKPAR
ncbi:MAG TPA: proton-conducting transporter membrane subunit [Pirellulales bacterium]|nr:proton-conducting transporter membrane subunit [Pirellulales bacterium]